MHLQSPWTILIRVISSIFPARWSCDATLDLLEEIPEETQKMGWFFGRQEGRMGILGVNTWLRSLGGCMTKTIVRVQDVLLLQGVTSFAHHQRTNKTLAWLLIRSKMASLVSVEVSLLDFLPI